MDIHVKYNIHESCSIGREEGADLSTLFRRGCKQDRPHWGHTP